MSQADPSLKKGKKDATIRRLTHASTASNFDILLGDHDVGEDTIDDTFTNSNIDLERHHILPKNLQRFLETNKIKVFPIQFYFRKTKVDK